MTVHGKSIETSIGTIVQVGMIEHPEFGRTCAIQFINYKTIGAARQKIVTDVLVSPEASCALLQLLESTLYETEATLEGFSVPDSQSPEPSGAD